MGRKRRKILIRQKNREEIIITTGVAGGLLCPCKGLLPAVHLVHVESLPLALLSQLTLKRLFTSFYLFVFSPVNGPIYSFRLI